MKVIPFYLPQFHRIPENDEWWGEGFTEWTNVRAAKPLYEGHYQPRVPQGDRYYDLTDPGVLTWQAKLAAKYGIYGFCFYHYWFDGHMLLERPMELLLEHTEIPLRFCVCWANESWTNAWAAASCKTLIAQNYGGPKQWKEHFSYLEKFMADERYIRIDGKPLLVIYRPELIPCLNDMIVCWRQLAIEHGLGGLTLAYQHVDYSLAEGEKPFELQIEYQPMYARTALKKAQDKTWRAKKTINTVLERVLHRTISSSALRRSKLPITFSYDEIWETILTEKPSSKHSIPCAFVDWDNTPRVQARGSVAVGANPEKFRRYFDRLIDKTLNEYQADMVFVFAWNEWAEGGYLEPDARFGTGYLEAIYDVLYRKGELPGGC